MNIHFSELDNTDGQQNFDNDGQQNFDSSNAQLNTPEKYWDNYQQQPSTKKKKVSFNDILSNMNLVVNQKGVLQFIQPMQNEEEYLAQMDQQSPYQQSPYQQSPYQQPYQEYVAQQKQQQEQIDPALKNSFLYNKYFKDYKDTSTYQPEIRVPKTMEEYRQMLIEDKIKYIQQKKRIEEIKSTKLMFTANLSNQSNNIQPTRNNLRSMNFH